MSSTNSTVDDEDDDEFVDNAIDLPWRNFLSPEFGTQSQGKYPIIWRFPFSVWHSGRKASVPKPARFVQSFRCNTGLWQTDWRTDGQTDAWGQHLASVASSCKNTPEKSQVATPRATKQNHPLFVLARSLYCFPLMFSEQSKMSRDYTGMLKQHATVHVWISECSVGFSPSSV